MSETRLVLWDIDTDVFVKGLYDDTDSVELTTKFDQAMGFDEKELDRLQVFSEQAFELGIGNFSVVQFKIISTNC